MKVQTCDHTWEGACAAEQRTKNTKQPALLFYPHRHEVRKALALSILFVLGCQPTTMPSHTFLMAHMKFGAHTSKTRESTVNYRSFWFLALYVELHFCTIFTHSVRHAGLARDRNTNLGALASETM
jgi:hypothetical protein